MSGKKKDIDISKQVMESIRSDDVQMKSRGYFVIISILLLGTTILIILLTAALLSAFVYDVQTGRDLQFEYVLSDGDWMFFSRFPWLLALITGGLFAVTVTLARKHEWTYKHRMISIIVAAFGIVLASSILLALVGASDNIASVKPLRPLTPYGAYAKDWIIAGKLIDIKESVYLVENYESEQIEVYIGGNTLILYEKPEIGDTLHIYIKKYGNQIEAAGIIVNPQNQRVKEIHDLRTYIEIKFKYLM